MEKPVTLDAPLTSLPGIGPQRAALFARLNVRTVGELLRLYPRTYEDRTRLVSVASLEAGTPACFEAAVVTTPRTNRIPKPGSRMLEVTKFTVADDTGRLNLTFFNAVQPFQRELRYDNLRSAVAEEGLLRMLFREPALLAQTEGLTAEDFSVPLFGRVYAALRERWQNDLAITPAALADSLSPAEMAHLTAVLQKQEPPLSETALADYLRILREERAKARVSDASDLLAMQRDLKKKKGYGGS